MSHENMRTTIVLRIAVAASESVFLMPHLASIEVTHDSYAQKPQ